MGQNSCRHPYMLSALGRHFCEFTCWRILSSATPPPGDEMDTIGPLSGENERMSDAHNVPFTEPNPAILGSSTVSRQIPTDDLDVSFRAIRDARARGDVDAVRRAWIDLGALLGIAVQDAPTSTVKRPRKRSP